ncbi:MAG: arylsulfotransferase family protein, partial [Rubrobacteraceae bacterium]
EAQFGPMIVDNDGQPVWFRPVRNEGDYSMDFKAQSYRGETVITWWEGSVAAGYGRGEWTVLDTSYREVARIRAGNGYQSDHHELLITPRDTALFTIYNPTRANLTSVGGSEDDEVIDGIVQEVDIETGEVLFEWHSLDHVAVEETYADRSEDDGAPFDYFHINSVDVDLDGNLLVSSRRTFAVYKTDREAGEVIWRLGGKRSDFEMGEGARTRYQHDARRREDGTLTIFDNGDERLYEESRGIVLDLDEDEMTAELAREYTHPDELLSVNQANMQTLPNGNVFLGWGWEPVFSETTSDGETIFSASLSPGANEGSETYRAYRFPWSGQPEDGPAVAAERESDDEATLYVSWNGATEVANWEVLAGPAPGLLESVGSAPRDGFETAITLRTSEPYVGARAKDRSGRELDASDAVEVVEPEN